MSFDYGRLFNIFLIHIIGFYLVLPVENFKISKKNLNVKVKYFFIYFTVFYIFLFTTWPYYWEQRFNF